MLEVFAGALADNLDQGVLIVFSRTRSKPTGDAHGEIAGEESGQLRILAVKEDGHEPSGGGWNQATFSMRTMKFEK